MITTATRVRNHSRTLLDVFLTIMPELFKECDVWNPGINDHSMVYGLTMENVRNHKSKLLFFLKQKNINEKEQLKHLNIPPRHVGSIFDSINDQYSYWSTLLNTGLKVSD